MTVRRGQDWGETGALSPDGVLCHGDGEARAVLEEARRADRPPPELGLLDGDLCRTLGGRRSEPDRLRRGPATRAVVDVGRVESDGWEGPHWFCAHLVARGRAWSGPGAVVMNAAWYGDWLLGPRAHPGDGLLDGTEGRLSLSDRLRARRRAREGGHVPHPGLTVWRSGRREVDLGRDVRVFLDGQPVGRARHLSITVEPDALVVVV